MKYDEVEKKFMEMKGIIRKLLAVPGNELQVSDVQIFLLFEIKNELKEIKEILRDKS